MSENIAGVGCNVPRCYVLDERVEVDPLRHPFARVRADDEQQTVLQHQHEQQVHDSALGGGEHAVHALAGRQVLQLVRAEPVQQVERVLARKLEASEVGTLRQSRGAREGVVLLTVRGVALRGCFDLCAGGHWHPSQSAAGWGGLTYTLNEVPQPQVVLAFGLLNTKPLPLSPPEYSSTVPARKT